MTGSRPHITVCICTYQRPALLLRLLEDLAVQATEDRFTFSISVVDNDRTESARRTVEHFGRCQPFPVAYCVQPVQNIALTRNRAVASATGDYMAFIDDDEFPIRQWLLILFQALQSHGVDGVLGPVKPHFDPGTPQWVIKGRFYDRTSYPTGLVIDWPKGRTGNVLFRRAIFEGLEEPFRKDFLTGEDQDFFRRMIEQGRRFIWCEEALAYEVVPPIRWKRSFMLRRALLRGKVSLRHPSTTSKDVLKSAIAIPLYLLALPFLLLLGQHRFMDCLVRLFDHLGRLLAFLGLDPVREKYVTE